MYLWKECVDVSTSQAANTFMGAPWDSRYCLLNLTVCLATVSLLNRFTELCAMTLCTLPFWAGLDVVWRHPDAHFSISKLPPLVQRLLASEGRQMCLCPGNCPRLWRNVLAQGLRPLPGGSPWLVVGRIWGFKGPASLLKLSKGHLNSRASCGLRCSHTACQIRPFVHSSFLPFLFSASPECAVAQVTFRYNSS